MELLRYTSVPSTQETARELALRSHRPPFVVVAETQSRGRGRLGREWQAPAGGLWVTVALSIPSAEVARQAALTVAFAVAHSIRAITGLHTNVKWPNDLLIGRRKVCGILAEALVQPVETTLLLGIGVNVNNLVDKQSLPRATSLREELHNVVELEDLLTVIVTEVESDISLLVQQGFAPFLPWMQSHLALVGESVTIEFNDQSQSGCVRGVSKTGALLLEDHNGLVREVDAGSVYYW